MYELMQDEIEILHSQVKLQRKLLLAALISIILLGISFQLHILNERRFYQEMQEHYQEMSELLEEAGPKLEEFLSNPQK